MSGSGTSKALDPWLARVVCYTFAKHMLHADFGTCFGATHESVRLPMLCNIQDRSQSTAPFSSLSRQLVKEKSCCLANHGYRHGHGMAMRMAGPGYRARVHWPGFKQPGLRRGSGVPRGTWINLGNAADAEG